MMEFALNSSINSSTGFTPFQLNCWYMPVLMQHINEGKSSTTPGVKAFVQQAIMNLEIAHDTIIESQVMQTYHANRKQNEGKPSKLEILYISP